MYADFSHWVGLMGCTTEKAKKISTTDGRRYKDGEMRRQQLPTVDTHSYICVLREIYETGTGTVPKPAGEDAYPTKNSVNRGLWIAEFDCGMSRMDADIKMRKIGASRQQRPTVDPHSYFCVVRNL